MNATGVVLSIVKPKNTAALRKAHEYAAEFHEAMERALRLEEEISDAKENARRETNARWKHEYSEEARELEPQYAKALGEAAFALQKMPHKWSALLSMELP
jgi:protein subunit release factor A